METPQAANQSPISGAAPLYQSPEPLSVEQHGKLGLKRSSHPFAFAAQQHYRTLTRCGAITRGRELRDQLEVGHGVWSRVARELVPVE